MKLITVILSMILICFSCSEDKVVKVQSDDIEWIGPLNPNGDQGIYDLTSNEAGTLFYYAGEFDLFRSTDNGSTWSQLANITEPSVYYIPTLIGGLQNNVYWIHDKGIFFSSDGGNNWEEQRIIGTKDYYPGIRISKNGDLFAVTYDSTESTRLFKSTDMGFNWDEIQCPLVDDKLREMTVDDNYKLYLLSDKGDLYASANSGNDWHLVRSGIDIPDQVFDIQIVDKYLFLYNHYYTFDKYDTLGNQYEMNYIYTDAVKDFEHTIDNTIYAATQEGIYTTSNFGERWELIPCEIKSIECIHLTMENYLFIAGHRRIFRSKEKI
ncbi:WD40/YVTN/BNR-like repeat-containing protein [Bacteroidota bacterium]